MLGYRLIGSHSGVKLCRWTKVSLSGSLLTINGIYPNKIQTLNSRNWKWIHVYSMLQTLKKIVGIWTSWEKTGQFFNRKQEITISVILERMCFKGRKRKNTVSCRVFLSLSDLHIKLVCSNHVHCYSEHITVFSDNVKLSHLYWSKMYLSLSSMCFFLQSMLRGRGGCYKHTFYGIESHRCMETTPSLACANKCVFCWRLAQFILIWKYNSWVWQNLHSQVVWLCMEYMRK